MKEEEEDRERGDRDGHFSLDGATVRFPCKKHACTPRKFRPCTSIANMSEAVKQKGKHFVSLTAEFWSVQWARVLLPSPMSSCMTVIDARPIDRSIGRQSRCSVEIYFRAVEHTLL